MGNLTGSDYKVGSVDSVEEAKVNVSGREIRVSIPREPDSEEREKRIQAANKAVSWFEEHGVEAKKHIVENMIDLQHNTWAESEEEKVTEDEFEQTLTLIYVSVQKNGKIMAMYEVGEIFLGHYITLLLSENLEYGEVSLEG